MRFLLKLNIDKNRYGNILPINYQYELSAVIYKTLAQASKEYATWLHDNGYQLENGKVFKMFCFSHLHFEKCKVIKGTDRLVILSDRAEFQVSFLPEDGTEKLITGLFSSRMFDLGDEKSKVRFEVSGIEALPSPDFHETMVYRSLSPIVISKKLDDARRQYLAPTDKSYVTAVKCGLKSRFEAFYGKVLDFNIEFEPLTEAKSSLITIKAGGDSETKVRGYNYSFKIKAPVEIQKMIYEAGIGELCSQGFGCVKVK